METENQQLVDYNKESQKLEEAQNRPDFWNAKEGKFAVIALGELSKYTYEDKKDNSEQVRARVDIEVEKVPYVWSFGIGSTKASLYGQLVDLATKNGGKLVGKQFTVVIKNDGKKRDFTIV